MAQRKLLEEGVLDAMVRLSESPLEDIRREVARFLALVACKEDSHTDLLQADAPEHMVGFLRSRDPVCQARVPQRARGNVM